MCRDLVFLSLIVCPFRMSVDMSLYFLSFMEAFTWTKFCRNIGGITLNYFNNFVPYFVVLMHDCVYSQPIYNICGHVNRSTPNLYKYFKYRYLSVHV